MELCAVITAGGRVDGAFAQAIGTPVKALAPFGGTTFLQRTVDAVAGIGVNRIAVVGGPEVRAAVSAGVRVVDESESGAENLRRALYAWNTAQGLLYLTSDMPFISPAALRAFVEALPGEALALPLTEWQRFEERFPGAPPFGITLAGEKVVNGGAFFIPPGRAAAVETLARRFFDARKSPLQMARLTGPVLLLQFLLRRLGVAQLEAHAQRLLGFPARAVRNAAPELAYDVDVLEEYRYALANA